MSDIHKFRYFGEAEVVPDTYDRILLLKDSPHMMKKFGAVPFWGKFRRLLISKS